MEAASISKSSSASQREVREPGDMQLHRQLRKRGPVEMGNDPFNVHVTQVRRQTQRVQMQSCVFFNSSHYNDTRVLMKESEGQES